jgi:hypothetical protein
MAGCHTLWGWNHLKDFIKLILVDVVSGRPEKSVRSYTMHTFHLYTHFIRAEDDSWIKVIIIFHYTPLPKTCISPLDFVHRLWIFLIGWLFGSSQDFLPETEVLCVKACTV